MIVQRLLRDVICVMLGASLAVMGIAGLKATPRARAQLPMVPADDPGELMAWALRPMARGSQFLDELPGSGLTPCRLPVDASLRPLLDERTHLPGRVAHWIDGGPKLYLMQLDTEAGTAAMRRDIAERAGADQREGDVANDMCGAGRLLVPAETIMNFLYTQSSRTKSEPK